MLRRFVPLRLVAVAHPFRTSTIGGTSNSVEKSQDTLRKYLEERKGCEFSFAALIAFESFLSKYGLTSPRESWSGEALMAAWKKESIESFVNSVEQLKLPPMEMICRRARRPFGGLSFITDTELDRINRRHLSPTEDKYYVKTILTKELEALKDTTAVIGGASGSGKTVAMLRMGSKGPGADSAVIVVYGTPDEELFTKEELAACSTVRTAPPTETSSDTQGRTVAASSASGEEEKIVIVEQSSFKKKLHALKIVEADDRNAAMLEILDDFVISHIDSETLGTIRALNAGRLTLVLALDEMGEYPAAVRAMCALTSAEVKKKLGFSESHPVEFRLVVGGTGIGEAGSPGGSSSAKFQNLYAKDDPSNFEIFADHALGGSFDIVKVRKVLEMPHNKVPRDVIMSNARMAAAYGDEVYRTLSLVRVTDWDTFLAKMDLLAYLTPAALQYKSRNALRELTLDELSVLAIRSIRMNMFPTARTFEQSYTQFRHGLVVDTSRYAKGDAQEGEVDLGPCGPSDTHHRFVSSYSKYEIPAFTVATVAAMTNLSCVTRSLSNGGSLGAHWHGASYLLACASASDKLLLKLFQDAHARNGSVKPLNYTSVRGTDGKVVVRDPLEGLSLPTKGTVVVSVEADYSHVQMTHAVFLNEVRKVFENLGAKMTKEKTMESYGKGVHICPIVSIRSPVNFKLADSMTLIDSSVFLFQMEAICSSHSKVEVDKEPWNMGEGTVRRGEGMAEGPLTTVDAPNEKDIQGISEPPELVRGIQRLWRTIIVEEAEEEEDVNVYRCFVTSSPSSIATPKEPTRNDKERNYGSALLLNVESIKFLNFDNSLSAPAEEHNNVARLT